MVEKYYKREYNRGTFSDDVRDMQSEEARSAFLHVNMMIDVVYCFGGVSCSM